MSYRSDPLKVGIGGTGAATASAGTVFGNSTGSAAAPNFGQVVGGQIIFSVALAGSPTTTTQTSTDNTTKIATTAFVQSQFPIVAAQITSGTITGIQIGSSIALAGSPTTTTQTTGDNSTNIATTAFVASSLGPKVTDFVSNTFFGGF